MTITAAVLTRYTVTNDDDNADDMRRDVASEVTCSAALPKSEVVSLANGFNALAPPTGAQWVTIEPLTGAVTWTLKGVTGDTGVALSNLALPLLPISMPVKAPSIGITVTGAATARVTWL